jgi:hypothetical protein
MAIPASNIIFKVGILLNDIAAVRWTTPELVNWLNDGQREVVMYRPDATASYVSGTLAVGTLQSLTGISELAALHPYKLLDITRNVAATSAKGVVRQASKDLMDAQLPSWHNATASVDITNFMYDPRTPNNFYVYPPATSTAKVELQVSLYPTDVTVPESGTYTSVAGNIGVSDTYANALVDYIMCRALLKDSEVGETAAKAALHYSAFTNAMGIEVAGTATNSPRTTASA